MMGGKMWVESEGIPGQGATFHFTIVAQAAPELEQPPLDQEQTVLKGKLLLIVDVNETSRYVLTHLAQAWGMLPQAAASAAVALEWVRRGDPFDLAILDLQMPEMDGLRLAREIRQEPRALTLPVVMLSIGCQDEAIRQSELTLATFLSKPIKKAQLFQSLLNALSRQRGEVSTPSTPAPIDLHLAERIPLRILLAEDNTINQKVALQMLDRMGYRADVAGNGLESPGRS